MSDETNGLPKYMIVPQGTADTMQGTDDAKFAEELVHQIARSDPGTYVAIYQRVVLVRKNT